MSDDKVSVMVDAVRTQIFSTRQILTIGTVSDLDDANIKAVIESLYGPEWHDLALEKQQTIEKIIRKIYEDQLKNYLPLLQKHLDEVKQITKPDIALLADLDFEPEEKLNTEPVHYGPETKQEFDRDQAARENLKSRYYTFKQGLRHVVQRRGAGKDVSVVPRADFKNAPLNAKGKKECPVCHEWFLPGSIQRHHQQRHAQDVRYAIYCPKKDCNHVEWRGDSTIDDHLRKVHNLFLGNTKTKMGTGRNKATKLVSSDGRGREDDQAEQAEKVQGGYGGEAMGDEMVDVYMADSEMIDGDMAEDSMFVDDTFDEDMNDLDF